MIKNKEAQPMAAMCLALGVALGAAAFFTFVYFSSAVTDKVIADNNASSPANQLPVVELQLQAGRRAPSDAMRM